MSHAGEHPLQAAFGRLCGDVARTVDRARADAEGALREAGARAAALAARVLPPPADAASPAAALASVSAAAAAPRRPAVGDLAYSPAEVRARLASVPVFAVVNAADEFVLVTGDDGARQLGLFFLERADAEGLIATIRAREPKLGKAARVLATSLDAVHRFASEPRAATGTEGVTFRFMPAAAEVGAALALVAAAGLPAAAFCGVPLFQAEGLTVKGEAARYTPLFFSKADLDAALGRSFAAKDSDAEAGARARAERARGEAAAAEAEAAAGARGAAKRAEAARARVAKYESELAKATAEKVRGGWSGCCIIIYLQARRWGIIIATFLHRAPHGNVFSRALRPLHTVAAEAPARRRRLPRGGPRLDRGRREGGVVRRDVRPGGRARRGRGAAGASGRQVSARGAALCVERKRALSGHR
jgi:hypothetical protein